jgi:hypothetical protein
MRRRSLAESVVRPARFEIAAETRRSPVGGGKAVAGLRYHSSRAYNRTAHLPARRKVMQQWADYFDDGLVRR